MAGRSGISESGISESGISDLCAFLVGPWRLARTIEDPRTGRAGMVRGEASFAPDGARLLYRERGRLRLGGYSGAAEQSYLYRFPARHRAAVCHGDGRAFHDLDLSTGHWEVAYACGADRYRGAFRVVAPDAFEVAWRILGPRKDALVRTRYRRRPAGAG